MWMLLSTLALSAPMTDRDVQRVSCENGEGSECTALGLRYQRGQSAPKDAHYALELFRRACTLGDPLGCVYQADAFRVGEGVRRDPTRAVKLYTDACTRAEMGRACRALGELYILGDGVTRDPGASMLWYEQGCEAGDADSCVGAALGVERGDLLDADPKQARAMLVKSCQELRHARGCTLLGHRYLDGADGAGKNVDGAGTMFILGCELGGPEACRHAGQMSVKGKGGLPRDEASAKLYLTDACAWDDYEGCRDLAKLLRRQGELEKASRTAHRGCELGDDPSCGLAKQIDWKLEMAAKRGE